MHIDILPHIEQLKFGKPGSLVKASTVDILPHRRDKRIFYKQNLWKILLFKLNEVMFFYQTADVGESK